MSKFRSKDEKQLPILLNMKGELSLYVSGKKVLIADLLETEGATPKVIVANIPTSHLVDIKEKEELLTSEIKERAAGGDVC